MTFTAFQVQAFGRVHASWMMAVAAACVVTFAASAQEPAGGGEQATAAKCNARTLRGAFGLLASGSRIVPFGPNAGKSEVVVGTGLRTYDGEGGFTEQGADLHGQLTGVTPDPGGIEGTYVVNDDCTGVSTRSVPGLPFPIVSNFVVVNGGRSLKEAVMGPVPSVITVLLERR